MHANLLVNIDIIHTHNVYDKDFTFYANNCEEGNQKKQLIDATDLRQNFAPFQQVRNTTRF